MAIELSDRVRNGYSSRLTPNEYRLVFDPVKFSEKTSLDEKMMIAEKLGKRWMILFIDDDKGLDHMEFAKLFRQTWINEAKNSKAIEIADDKGIVAIANETVGRFIQKYELFIGSDMFEAARVMKRIKNKKVGIQNHHFNNNEFELKMIFMSTILRTFFAVAKMKEFLKYMGLHQVEFAMLCVLYLSGRPMELEMVRLKTEMMLNRHIQRLMVKRLGHKNYIHIVEKESTHIVHKAGLWMITHKGQECIQDFIRKVTEETIGKSYE